MRILFLALIRPRWWRPCSAVPPAIGTAAASAIERIARFSERASTGTLTYSAKPP
jgi:hypothetical protein